MFYLKTRILYNDVSLVIRTTNHIYAGFIRRYTPLIYITHEESRRRSRTYFGIFNALLQLGATNYSCKRIEITNLLHILGDRYTGLRKALLYEMQKPVESWPF